MIHIIDRHIRTRSVECDPRHRMSTQSDETAHIAVRTNMAVCAADIAVRTSATLHIAGIVVRRKALHSVLRVLNWRFTP